MGHNPQEEHAAMKHLILAGLLPALGLSLAASGAAAQTQTAQVTPQGNPQIMANCRPAGHSFPQIVWDSGFADVASANSAIQTLQTLNQPTYSTTQDPMRMCCSNTARPAAFYQTCGRGPAGDYQNICNHPNITYIVGYRWVCEGAPRGAPAAPLRSPDSRSVEPAPGSDRMRRR
jgi:hypothetical protein